MFRRIAPAVLLALAGCLPLEHKPVPRFTVEQVLDRSKNLQGQRVAVTGAIERTSYNAREASTFVVLGNSSDPRTFPSTRTLLAVFKGHIPAPRVGTRVAIVGDLVTRGDRLRLSNPRFQSVEN